MSCVKGTYPVKENEIAVDAGKAKELGVAPVPGSTVKLQLFDYKKKKLVLRFLFHEDWCSAEDWDAYYYSAVE